MKELASAPRYDLVFAGNTSLDTVKLRGITKKNIPGGSALSSALASRQFHHLNTAVFTTTGFDYPITLFQDVGIDISKITAVEKESTKFLLDEDESIIKLKSEEYLPLSADSASICTKHLHISNRVGVDSNKILKDADYVSGSFDVMFSKSAGKRKSIDSCLQKFNLLFCNSYEEEVLFNEMNVQLNRYEDLLRIVTCKDHVLLKTTDDIEKIECFAVEDKIIKSTTGAGDSFLGAFLGAFVSGHRLEEALAYGIATASFSIEEYGILHLAKKHEAIKSRFIELREIVHIPDDSYARVIYCREQRKLFRPT